MIRRFFKKAAVGFVGASVAATATYHALSYPRYEDLPAPLFRVRVTMEGLVRLGRCIQCGARAMYEFKWRLPANASADEWEAAHLRTAQSLLDLAMRNQALFIKTAQSFSAQNHVLPPTYCRVLAKCHNQVTRRPISEIYSVLDQELGRDWRDVFVEFDEDSIAAASLAQVHRARLRDTGDEVAVKVQYFDCSERYDGDVNVILLMLRLTGMLFEGFDFGKLVQQGEAILRQELDFAREAQSLERCDKNLRAEFGDAVRCPRVFHKVSTKRVLVTEFIDGVHPDNTDELRRRGIDICQGSDLLAQAIGFELFKMGYGSADPHCGNIYLRPRPSDASQVQVVLLDYGLCFDFTPQEMKDMSEVWTCAATRDDAGLDLIMAELGLPTDEITHQVFPSMFLQAPYVYFSPQQRKISAQAKQEMDENVAATMPIVTQCLEALPHSFALCLRTLNTHRSVHKKMGNPVSRATRYLMYSIRTAREDRLSFMGLQMALLRVWWEDFKQFVFFTMLYWWDPTLEEKIESVIEDSLQIG